MYMVLWEYVSALICVGRAYVVGVLIDVINEKWTIQPLALILDELKSLCIFLLYIFYFFLCLFFVLFCHTIGNHAVVVTL